MKVSASQLSPEPLIGGVLSLWDSVDDIMPKYSLGAVSNALSDVNVDDSTQMLGHLDRYLPAVDKYVHYRSIDVSSLKELCRRWNPAVYKGRPGKRETHRALDDIRESIEELRFYRDRFLQLPPTGDEEAATTADAS